MDVKDINGLPPEVQAALIAKLEAEAASKRAEARYDTARAEQAEHETEASHIGLQREHHRRRRELQSDFHRRFFRFDDQVSAKSAAECINQIAEWARLDRDAGVEDPHIKIQFNSPGGSVTDGLALFDEIQHWRRLGVRFTTSTIGMAASMAGILLQAGDKRVMAPESWLMIHQAAFGAIGQTFEIEDRVAWVKKQQERILDIFAQRAAEAGENGTAEKPISRRAIAKNWDRKDWWISSDEALRFGLVDEVR